jgi:hypothetical protein
MTKYLSGSLVAALVLAAPALAANLLTNPGFEDGNTGNIADGIPGWSAWGNSGWHHDDAGRTIDAKAIKFWWDDAGVWQDVTVVAGQSYRYGLFAYNAGNDALVGWNGLLKAEFYNSALGTDPGHKLGEIDVDRFYSATDPRDQWVALSGTVVVPAGANLARIIVKIADWQSSGVGGSLNFDAASIELVPEPAALGLLLAGLLALRRVRN